jgi:membrane-associated protease RseP (regulator of RpoE activity)
MNEEPREPLDPEIQPSSIFEVEPESRSTAVDRPGDGLRHFPTSSTQHPPRSRLALILFLLTCASTIYAGTFQFIDPMTVIDPATGKEQAQVEIDSTTGNKIDLINWRQSLLNGLTYATAVLLMLGAHEMGHYLQARRYGVPASLPLFIPMPFGPLGTMGAVIVQQAGVADRKSMFDIAISGPLAGLAVALPLNWWGILHSRVKTIQPNEVGWSNPLIVEWMVGWIHKPLQPGEDIMLNPILFAGWVGIFITGLILIPIGQLDGGHILYCLVGRKAHRIARALYVGAVAVVVFQVLRGHNEYSAWMLMLLLVGFMGTQHPPTADDRAPLGKLRIFLGWLTLAFIFIGFVPSPKYINKGPSEPGAPTQQSSEVEVVAEAESSRLAR